MTITRRRNRMRDSFAIWDTARRRSPIRKELRTPESSSTRIARERHVPSVRSEKSWETLVLLAEGFN